jgi:hypothetical protein
MFYIIASRIPLVYSDPTNRKFLKIFILGSLLYICIHYYLHLDTRSNIIEKIKSKLLFVMAGDFLIACTLAKFLSPVIPTSADAESEESDKPKYLATEKDRIMKELEERRKAEMLKAQAVQQQAALAAQQQAAQQAALVAQQSQQMQQVAQKAAQVKIQEAAAQEKADKSKVKSKSTKKKDDTTTSSSSSSSSSSESEKPKKSDKKVEKKSKKDKRSSDEESTEMPVYE